MQRHVKKLWTHDVGLTVLLGVLFFQIFIFYPLVDSELERIVLVHISFLLVLVSGVMTVVGTPIWGRLLMALAVVSVVLRFFGYVYPFVWLESLNVIMNASFVAMLMGVILVQVFREGAINFHRIAGSVALYLLIGVFFACIYSLLDFQSPSSFSMAEHLGSRDPHIIAANLVYFSFITLTSVGYGDILPVHPLAKTTAILESLVGQLFPAILLARLVSMEIEERQKKLSEKQ